ncbi:dATP/dGTP pyrophosphohydrolase domain-containing protein [Burkholderia gladioli]|uniref:dATP/dGTP pyrophosphohydrolase domain-containing protein n=1 Tax=Burkholderia gladioli TaxID=28095 RepID=UPI00163EB5F6|nr:dATP/dGTP pyrophosphohydrolase domain-containing protein [Burkholderia gladioli]
MNEFTPPLVSIDPGSPAGDQTVLRLCRTDLTPEDVEVLRDVLKQCGPRGVVLLPFPQFDMHAFLARQQAFSTRTFGPGTRTGMVCDHIRKELIEVEVSQGDLGEWVDVILLALDGALRTGATPDQITEALAAKLALNEERSWPDWRQADPARAIEHVHAQEGPA